MDSENLTYRAHLVLVSGKPVQQKIFIGNDNFCSKWTFQASSFSGFQLKTVSPELPLSRVDAVAGPSFHRVAHRQRRLLFDVSGSGRVPVAAVARPQLRVPVPQRRLMFCPSQSTISDGWTILATFQFGDIFYLAT